MCMQLLQEQHQGVILSKAMVLGVQEAYLITGENYIWIECSACGGRD